MSKVIYQVDTYEFNVRQEEQKDRYKNMCDNAIPTVRAYADRIGAEYRCIKGDEATARIAYTGRQNSTNGWDYATKMKFKTYVDFASTSHTHFLFLDLDIRITDISPDIFEMEEYKALGGLWARQIAVERRSHKDWLKATNGTIVNDFYNGGVTLCDRPTALKISKHVPADEVFFSVKSEWGDWRGWKEDEIFLAYIIEKENIKVRQLHFNWNRFWTQERKAKLGYFIHHQGPAGKVALSDEWFSPLGPPMGPPKPLNADFIRTLKHRKPKN